MCVHNQLLRHFLVIRFYRIVETNFISNTLISNVMTDRLAD